MKILTPNIIFASFGQWAEFFFEKKNKLNAELAVGVTFCEKNETNEINFSNLNV